MYPTNPYNKYKENDIYTKSPGELTVMLFEGCWKFMKKAKIAIEDKNIQEANTNLIKAQNIILELINSLDLNYEISRNLLKVYDFIYRELVDINIHKDAERLDPLIDIIYGYYETWQEAVKKDRMERQSGTGAGGYI